MLSDELERLMDLEVRAAGRVTGRPPVTCPVCSRLVPARLLTVHAEASGDAEHAVLLVMEG